jgi:hypothetical protein
VPTITIWRRWKRRTARLGVVAAALELEVEDPGRAAVDAAWVLALKPPSTPAKAKRCDTSSGSAHDNTIPSVWLSGTAAHTRPLAHEVSVQASSTHIAKESPMQAVTFPMGN